jgi:hypothetical protein
MRLCVLLRLSLMAHEADARERCPRCMRAQAIEINGPAWASLYDDQLAEA